MIFVILIVFGLCLGSFANAVVWRLHEQGKKKTKQRDLSITQGHSMCPQCKHRLAAMDLIPVFSWLALKGKCRYCHKSISWQYPVVEILTALLFVVSYAFWPFVLGTSLSYLIFGLWLACLVCFMILAVYDIRWTLLPDKITFILIPLASILSLLILYDGGFVANEFAELAVSLILTAGLFGGLFLISSGKWIGFGDVKLVVALGILAMIPANALLLLFLASLLGSFYSVPGMLTGRLKRTSHVPFGPFLIVAGIIVFLWGNSITSWLQNYLLVS